VDKSQMESLIKCVVWGILWSIIFILIGFIIANFTPYILKDVLFVEGMLIVIVAASSSISGNPLGLSLQALGQNSAQYVANANLEAMKMEKQKQYDNFKTGLRSSLNAVSLIIGGVICIVINFMI
jgi:cobalamin biosynthesis protein CobD/CbiB